MLLLLYCSDLSYKHTMEHFSLLCFIHFFHIQSILSSQNDSLGQIYFDFPIFAPNHYCLGENRSKYLSCSNPKKVLVVLQNVLLPTQLGCDKRAFFILESLQALGHTVHVVHYNWINGQMNAQEKYMMRNLKATVTETPLATAVKPKGMYR